MGGTTAFAKPQSCLTAFINDDRGDDVLLGLPQATDEKSGGGLTAALSAPEPPGPFEQRQPGAVALDVFGNIGLDLVPAVPAPNE